MATINLGAIKFNWKGAFNNSTAYAVDDVVSSGGNSYVCIQASQGNAVGNATAYWNIMSAAGTNGSNGTDLSSLLSTRGDLVFKNASALARLPKGTNGYFLKQGANDPEWGAVDLTNLSASNLSSGTIPNARYGTPTFNGSNITNLSAGGKILQVVSTNKIDVFQSSTSSYVDITNFSAGLTPSATSSKILVQVSLGSFQSSGSNNRAYGRLKQSIASGATTYPFLPSNATGIESIVTTCFRSNDGSWHQMPVSFMRLTGALNTTAAVTFTVQANGNGAAFTLNRSNNVDSNTGNCSSAITLFEIAG